MKTERIIWGLIFLFIGGVLLLDNFKVIDFHWDIIWRFWPLVLIIIGANLLFSREDAGRAGVLAIIATLAALVFIGYQGTRPESSRQVWEYPRNNDEEEYKNESYRNSTFTEPLTTGVHFAELNITGGATEYTLSDTTSELFKADVRRRMGNYSLFKTTRDSIEVLNFKMTGKKSWNTRGMGSNKAVLMLNSSPVWDINLEVGAGKIDFDLTAFKIKRIKFEGGASSVKLKLGEPQTITTIDAETGVSEIEIAVPQSAACKINIDTGLSSNEFEGFSKQADGSYQTSNFRNSEKQIVINLEGGLSQFKVKRY